MLGILALVIAYLLGAIPFGYLLVKFTIGHDQDPGLFVTSVVQRIEDVVDTHTLIAFNAFTPNINPA